MARILQLAEDGHWQTLFGGRTNSAWLVSGDDTSAVLKLYRQGGQNPLFPNDPKAEAQMLRYLKCAQIAPSLISEFSVEDAHCNLYEALPGRAWMQDVLPVAALIRRLHALTAPKGLRVVANGSEELLAHALHIMHAAGAPGEIPARLRQISEPPTSSVTLLHGDIVPGNLICHGADLRLIDWQCPAVGDPTEDLAIFLSPAMQLLYRGSILSDVEVADFLAAFSSEQQRRYRSLAPLYHFRMIAYCRWQIARGQLEYSDALKVEEQALMLA